MSRTRFSLSLTRGDVLAAIYIVLLAPAKLDLRQQALRSLEKLPPFLRESIPEVLQNRDREAAVTRC